MMKRGDEELRIEWTDGEEILIPTEAGWERLKARPEIDGVPLGVQDQLWGLLTFVRQYPEFTLGLFRRGSSPHQTSATLPRNTPSEDRTRIPRLILDVMAISRIPTSSLLL